MNISWLSEPTLIGASIVIGFGGLAALVKAVYFWGYREGWQRGWERGSSFARWKNLSEDQGGHWR